MSRSAIPSVGAALALSAAAGLHLAAFPQHRQEGAVVAAFFLVVAALQVVAAVAVQRGVSRGLRALIAAGNAGLVLLWAVSRTVGIPGVTHGGGEPVGLLDLLAVAAEAAVVIGLLVGRTSLLYPVTLRATVPALAIVAVLVCGAALQWIPATHTHDVQRIASTPAEAGPGHGAGAHTHRHP